MSSEFPGINSPQMQVTTNDVESWIHYWTIPLMRRISSSEGPIPMQEQGAATTTTTCWYSPETPRRLVWTAAPTSEERIRTSRRIWSLSSLTGATTSSHTTSAASGVLLRTASSTCREDPPRTAWTTSRQPLVGILYLPLMCSMPFSQAPWFYSCSAK